MLGKYSRRVKRIIYNNLIRIQVKFCYRSHLQLKSPDLCVRRIIEWLEESVLNIPIGQVSRASLVNLVARRMGSECKLSLRVSLSTFTLHH